MSTWLQTLGHRERVPGYRHWDTGNGYLATDTGTQRNEYLATDTGTQRNEYLATDTGTQRNEYLATDTGTQE